MIVDDLLTISPLIVLTLAPVIVMLSAAFHRSHGLALGLTLAGLATATGTLFVAASQHQRQVTPLLLLDDYALFFIGLLAVATALVAVLSWGYLQQRRVRPEEYYVLLLTATLGGATLVASTHFASFFLGLEILSVSLYTLIAYPIYARRLVEAAVKYLVLAGSTSAFLVFGMAIVYVDTGVMTVSGLAPYLGLDPSGSHVVTAIGLVLLLVGVGFKLALVPFHLWTPDVYEGAPAPVTAYIATVSKGAVFALLLRYLHGVSLSPDSGLFLIFAGIAISSMLAGNLLALRQDNVKRMLAYSSIAHLGYLLVAFLATERAGTAVTFYLVVYFATTLAAFGVVTALSTCMREAEWIEDYRGLARSQRWTASAFTIALFSLAGMPLTMGFIGKLYLITAGAGSALWALVIALVVTSAIGLYYYSRVIITMWVSEPEKETRGNDLGADMRTNPLLRELMSTFLHGVPTDQRPDGPVVGRPAGVVLAGLTVFLLVFGVYPEPLIRLIEHAVATLP